MTKGVSSHFLLTEAGDADCESVKTGAEEDAEVWDEDDGMRKFFTGFKKPEDMELKEISGGVLKEWTDESGCALSVDMTVAC